MTELADGRTEMCGWGFRIGASTGCFPKGNTLNTSLFPHLEGYSPTSITLLSNYLWPSAGSPARAHLAGGHSVVGRVDSGYAFGLRCD